MTWKDAKNAYSKLGESWRLPDEKELELIINKLFVKNKGNFKPSAYWSSNVDKAFYLDQNIKNKDSNYNSKGTFKCFVRAVRDCGYN